MKIRFSTYFVISDFSLENIHNQLLFSEFKLDNRCHLISQLSSLKDLFLNPSQGHAHFIYQIVVRGKTFWELVCQVDFTGVLYELMGKQALSVLWSCAVFSTKYSRTDQVTFLEYHKLIPSIFLKAVLHNFYLVCSWIRCPIWNSLLDTIIPSPNITLVFRLRRLSCDLKVLQMTWKP